MNQKEIKVCIVCKRSFTNRKKWKRRNIWENVLYCSDGCRKRKFYNTSSSRSGSPS
ncbi:MAG: DUF2256 domain-containing protein [Patescibacteria group bacterium]|nr:DUF2256 domain-containing protein [Patescibacteria group bacterium]